MYVQPFLALSSSAPRMWRCFLSTHPAMYTAEICSTHVEMFLVGTSTGITERHLLHACGDVSFLPAPSSISPESAPRMWRCFWDAGLFDVAPHICSTHVEMFLSTKFSTLSPMRSAPRMWRCFLYMQRDDWVGWICSTHVEMFLRLSPIINSRKNLLHACGDVSPLACKLEHGL